MVIESKLSYSEFVWGHVDAPQPTASGSNLGVRAEEGIKLGPFPRAILQWLSRVEYPTVDILQD